MQETPEGLSTLRLIYKIRVKILSYNGQSAGNPGLILGGSSETIRETLFI